MTRRMLMLPFLIVIFAFLLPSSTSQAEQGCSACSLIQRVLKDAEGLKPGTVRKDIEAHNFTQAGGMTVRNPTRYIYKDCRYVEVEIEFNLDPTVEQDFSEKDTIKRVSKPTLGYPVTD